MTISKPAPVWLSEQDVRSLVQKARKTKTDLLALIKGIEDQIAKRRDHLNSSLSDLDVRARLQAVETAASTLKATLKAESSKQRTELLRSIARLNEQAKAAIQFYDNPVQVLLRGTIASAKRTTIATNLAAAGQVELKAFASLAVATKDADMASAVVSRLHAITPSSARPVSPRYVADALVGEVQRELHGGLLEVDSLLTEAALANRLFENGRAGTSGIGSVEVALKRRRLAEVGGAAIGDEGDE